MFLPSMSFHSYLSPVGISNEVGPDSNDSLIVMVDPYPVVACRLSTAFISLNLPPPPPPPLTRSHGSHGFPLTMRKEEKLTDAILVVFDITTCVFREGRVVCL